MVEQKIIGDVINNNLTGDVKENALSFTDFLRANDLLPEWSEKHDGWNTTYNDKNIVFLKVINNENVFAIIFNTCDFDDGSPVDDGLKEFVWAHLVVCPQGCGSAAICKMSQKSIMVLGKEYENVCIAPLECYNLEGNDLENAKRLVQILKYKIDKQHTY